MQCKFSVGKCVILGVLTGAVVVCAGKDKDKAACPFWSHSGRKFKVE